MAIHKLADGPITMNIAAVRGAEGKFGPQFVYTSDEGTDVYLSELASENGLKRLNLTLDTVAGKMLRFEQVKKDGKTYTNVSFGLAGASDSPAAAAPIPALVAATPKRTFEDLHTLYAQCVETAIMTLGMKCEAAGIPLDASAIQAGAATLFIASK
jgi:hypothetical protein